MSFVLSDSPKANMGGKTWLDILRCPECHGQLHAFKNNLICPKCHITFLIRDGIPSFLNHSNDFYEGKFIHTEKSVDRFSNPVMRLLTSFYISVSIDNERERFFKKIFKKKSNLLILDLGCGGGRTYFTKFGTVIGVDISYGSLVHAKQIYEMVVHADVLKSPFPSETFDLVISTDLVGHIPLESKEKLISEIYRVLKPGGGVAHSIECDSQSLLYRWMRRFPNLYQKNVVEMYGHYGLELPSTVFRRFRRAGFIPVVEKADPCRGYLRPIQSYVTFFDNEYKEQSVWLKILVSVCKLLSRNSIVRRLVNFISGLFVPLADLVTPCNYRDSVKVFYYKPCKRKEGSLRHHLVEIE